MFFRRAGIAVEPFTMEQAHLARQAFHDFGKGRHAAGLNFGDCFAHALAMVAGEPLLFKGEGFKRTDIASALMTPAPSTLSLPGVSPAALASARRSSPVGSARPSGGAVENW